MPKRGYIQTATHRKNNSLNSYMLGKKLKDVHKKTCKCCCCIHSFTSELEIFKDPVKYRAIIHRRIVDMYGKADHCENIKCTGKSTYYEWSNKKHDYKSFARTEWQQLCISCHQLYDNVFNRNRPINFNKQPTTTKENK